MMSAELGKGNKGSRYLFHKTPEQIGGTWFVRFFSWMKSLFCEPKPPPYSFSVDPRDESGCRALGEIRNQGIGQAANALAQSTDHVICDGLYTHFKREEDTGMKSGKLDEELGRMSDIIDHITLCSMILLNESFAATNEREGSEIGRQIMSTLVDERIKVICVTHLYELAQGFYAEHKKNALFLRAERETRGNRTFKLIVGEPLPTSFGEDLYADIFGAITESGDCLKTITR
jgi:hypothetical protein